MRLRLSLLLLLGSFSPLTAATLPTGMSGAEINALVETVGQASTLRWLRGAEPLQSWPGIRVGLQMDALPTGDVATAGDATSSVPGMLFVPRLHISKGLFFKIEAALDFFPASPFDFGTQAFGLKWTFTSEHERWLTGAVFGSISKFSGFEDKFEGSNMEAGVLLSKDYVRINAFAGLGLLFSNGSVDTALVRTPAIFQGTHSTLHLFLGAEWNGPISLSAQVDFFNLAPTATLFVGKKF